VPERIGVAEAHLFVDDVAVVAAIGRRVVHRSLQTSSRAVAPVRPAP
jgi:hypothetical protein